MKQIEINQVSFSYAKNPILKEVSTQIEKGAMVALMGPNGSGKSTLMKCLNKIMEIESGTIFLDGENIKDIPQKEIAKKIAYVPQHEMKVSGVRVFDMVLSGRMPYISWEPSEADYQKVEEIIHQLNLSSLAMKDFRELSGGQQQMVYIARAIVQETPIILLDEPTNNLDIKHQIEIMKLLKSLSQQGKTIMITLHDMNLALRYCSHFILVKSGEISVQGGIDVLTTEHIEALYQVKIKMIKDEEGFFIIPYDTNNL